MKPALGFYLLHACALPPPLCPGHRSRGARNTSRKPRTTKRRAWTGGQSDLSLVLARLSSASSKWQVAGTKSQPGSNLQLHLRSSTVCCAVHTLLQCSCRSHVTGETAFPPPLAQRNRHRQGRAHPLAVRNYADVRCLLVRKIQ